MSEAKEGPIDLNAEIEKRRHACSETIARCRAQIASFRKVIADNQAEIAALPRPPIKRTRKAAAK